MRLLPFPQISTILSNATPPANPFPRPTCIPLCQPCHAHSNNNIVILDCQYLLCYGALVFDPGGERSASLCPLSLCLPRPPIPNRRPFPALPWRVPAPVASVC